MQAWTNGRIHIHPWQTIPDQMVALGLTDADGMTQAWFVNADGSLTGGAEAVNAAMRYCWWIRPFTFLYHIPGIRQLQDWVYKWVAANRYRLPGSTPQCKIDNK